MKRFLIPADSTIKVMKPEGGFLSEQGEEVEDSKFWRRRMEDKSVFEYDAQQKDSGEIEAEPEPKQISKIKGGK